MNFLDRLASEIRSNNLVVFLGAGLSMSAGLPNWVSLIEPLAHELGRRVPPPEFLTGIHLLEIAEVYKRETGRNVLLRYLKEKLDPPKVEPSPTHDLVTSIFSRGTIITTNYDSLMERAYRKALKSYQLIVTDPDLAYWDESKVQIIKLRGDLGQPDSLVVTKTDYDVYPLRAPLIRNHLQSLFVAKTVLFIGYSFSDPDLQLLMAQLQYLLGPHARNVYALFLDPTNEDVASSRSKGIQPYAIDSTSLGKTLALKATLESILDKLKSLPNE